ncbi:hypothetical protein [Bosea sp. ANAM02]|uniref:hypothetical protein n=1 Tax=Bosea sp. ANAM02 TaxID=2020412 RepID=UPI00140F3371|nr:hypothetical protein [Bosea sp. ANAM02]BCB22355.1 hypothetical protein OCUBac02_52490 [Bosea sp. ANAM02]
MSRVINSLKVLFSDAGSNTVVIAALLPGIYKSIVHLGSEVGIIDAGGSIFEQVIWSTVLAAAAFSGGSTSRMPMVFWSWVVGVAVLHLLIAVNTSGLGAMISYAFAAAVLMGALSGRLYASAMRARSVRGFAVGILGGAVAASFALAPMWNISSRFQEEASAITAAGSRLLDEYREIAKDGAPEPRAHFQAMNRFAQAILKSPFNDQTAVLRRHMDFDAFERFRLGAIECKAVGGGERANCLEKLGALEGLHGPSDTRTAVLLKTFKIALGKA